VFGDRRLQGKSSFLRHCLNVLSDGADATVINSWCW